MKTNKKGTCVYEKDIHVSHKGQGAATNREKGQGVTRTRVGAAPCKNGLARTLIKFISDLRQVSGFQGYSSFHDITELLLKVALNIIILILNLLPCTDISHFLLTEVVA